MKAPKTRPKTASSAPGSSVRPVERGRTRPDCRPLVVADLPTGWRVALTGWVRHDRDRADREALERYGASATAASRRQSGVLRRSAEPRPHYAARFAGKEAVGKALGLGVARLFAWGTSRSRAAEPSCGCPAASPSGRTRGAGAIDLSSRIRASWRARSAWWPNRMLEPLYTAAEMKAAEEGHNVEELMQRRCSGRGRASSGFRRRRSPPFAARGRTGETGGSRRSELRSAGWEERSLGEADVVVDALSATGSGAAEGRAAAQSGDERRGRPIVAVDIASGVDASSGECRAMLLRPRHGTFTSQVGHEVAPAAFVPARSWSPTSGSSTARPSLRASP